MIASGILGVVAAAMLGEWIVSRRHERALRARGAREPAGDVYRALQVAYPVAFAGMALEGWMRRPQVDAWFWGGAAVFLAAKALKYWAIATLGPLWTFRVLVLPAHPLVRRGPYRWLRHPNYLGVAGELAGVALLVRAVVTGPLGILMFAGLLARRIRVEEQAIAAAHADPPAGVGGGATASPL